MTHPQIVPTAQLTYDGAAGYRKTIAAVLGTVLAFLTDAVDVVPEDWKKWVQLAIGVLTAVLVYALPNAVKPTPPAPVDPPDDGAV